MYFPLKKCLLSVVGQGPIALAVGAGCLDILFLSSIFCLFFLSLWETNRIYNGVEAETRKSQASFQII